MQNNARITLEDSPMSAMVKMADGNPGAIIVLKKLFQEGADIDPDSFMGGFMKVLSLDTHKIYGYEIWQFYKDLCKQNLVDMIGMMRAVQLGKLCEEDLLKAIRHGAPSPEWVTEHVNKVREMLPAFGKVPA